MKNIQIQLSHHTIQRIPNLTHLKKSYKARINAFLSVMHILISIEGVYIAFQVV